MYLLYCPYVLTAISHTSCKQNTLKHVERERDSVHAQRHPPPPINLHVLVLSAGTLKKNRGRHLLKQDLQMKPPFFILNLDTRNSYLKVQPLSCLVCR